MIEIAIIFCALVVLGQHYEIQDLAKRQEKLADKLIELVKLKTQE